MMVVLVVIEMIDRDRQPWRNVMDMIEGGGARSEVGVDRVRGT